MRRPGSRRPDFEELNVQQWKYPDEGALGTDALKSYRARKKAVQLYFKGATERKIKQETGIGLSQTYRLITERCLAVHPDGEVWGWRALIKGVRINPYQRKKKVIIDKFGLGGAGALNDLFNEFPNLREDFNKRILKPIQSARLGVAKKKARDHWQWFLEKLRDIFKEKEIAAETRWPFNTENRGYVSVCRYIKRLYNENPERAALLVGGPDNQKKMESGDGTNRPVLHLFQRVEMDGHKTDGRFCVLLPQQDGSYLKKVVHRLWVIVILEVTSRAVLGYYLSMRREVSKYDVLRAIKCALTKWNKPSLTFGENAYRPGANLPSGHLDKFIGVCWDETSVDGALAETCKTVKERLRDIAGSALLEPNNSFSVTRRKDDRPFIETFFRALGERGLQRLSNTTGANPEDKDGRDPDAVALASEFQVEYAHELLAALIANYNATPHTSLGGRSPLEYLEFHANRLDQPLRYADPESVSDLVSFRQLRTVKGGYDEGRKPYVNFAHGRYSGSILDQRQDLVGKKIWVINHLENDVRVVRASTKEGQPLGLLKVSAPWHTLPHSLEIRSAVAALIKSKKLQESIEGDAIRAFLLFVQKQANNKLPVHPMYLAQMRILGEVAEQYAGKSQLDVVREMRAQQENGSAQSAKVTDDHGKPTISPARGKSALPPPRKAANK